MNYSKIKIKTLNKTGHSTLRWLCGLLKSDSDLQREYEGILPRIKSVLKLINDDKQNAYLEGLVSKKVVPSGD